MSERCWVHLLARIVLVALWWYWFPWGISHGVEVGVDLMMLKLVVTFGWGVGLGGVEEGVWAVSVYLLVFGVAWWSIVMVLLWVGFVM
jgi:hypothetical protein